MDDTKVKAIMDWPAPSTVCSGCSFLGLTNFYCCFIKDYACYDPFSSSLYLALYTFPSFTYLER